MYLRTYGVELLVVATFLPTYLIREDVSPCLLSSFSCCCWEHALLALEGNFCAIVADGGDG